LVNGTRLQSDANGHEPPVVTDRLGVAQGCLAPSPFGAQPARSFEGDGALGFWKALSQVFGDP
jgi:hypothetical protein